MCRCDLKLRSSWKVKPTGTLSLLSFQTGGGELLVLEEKVDVDGKPVYAREVGQALIEAKRGDRTFNFPIDRQLVALPIIQQQLTNDPVSIVKRWLARMMILRPLPSLISGDSNEETLEPNPQLTDFGAWFSGLVAHAPSAYAEIDNYLKQVMPDLKDIKNPSVGKDARSLEIQFSNDQGSATFPFEDLSDGEKCFMICALVIAANHAYGPVFCFWDEPDNYLALSEVGHFVLALRKTFQSGGQFVATSHNPEVVRSFSDENTLVLYRNNRLEPTKVRALKDIRVNGDIVGALIRDDIEP